MITLTLENYGAVVLQTPLNGRTRYEQGETIFISESAYTALPQATKDLFSPKFDAAYIAWAGAGVSPAQLATAVNTALASNSTVTAAAATAVTSALDDVGVLHSQEITETSVEFASVDAPEVPIFKFSKLEPEQGWKFAAAYANGEVAFGIRADGSYYPEVAAPQAEVPIAGPDIYAPGDSLTVGSGGNGTNFPGVVQSLMIADGKPGVVRNGGVGGEPSRTIAARAGGRPMLATVAGGVLPATGSVGVTLLADNGGSVTPLLQGTAYAGINPVTVGGVQWNLAKDGSGLYSLNRITDGAAITADYPLAVLTASRTDRRGDILLMQWGQNDSTEMSTDTGGAELISRLKAQIEWQYSVQKKYLVLGFVTAGLTARKTVHDNMRQAFGRRFVNVLEFLCSPAAFRVAGIVPTSDDLTAMTNGSKPPSFWAAVDDSVHNNAAGYTAIGYLVYNRLIELGDI